MRWYTFSICLLIIFMVGVIDWSESGRIVRAGRRNGRGGPGRPYSYNPWWRRSRRPHSRRPLNHHLPSSSESHRPGPGSAASSATATATTTTDNRRTSGAGEASMLTPVSAMDWQQQSAPRRKQFGNAMGRDPTFDYVPPSNERVKFLSEMHGRRVGRKPPNKGPPRPLPPNGGRPGNRRNSSNRRKSQYFKQNTPLLWKFLANRQRWRNRRPRPRPNSVAPGSPKNPSSHEAEVVPYLPHIVFFQHSDRIPASGVAATTKDNFENATILAATSNNNSTLRPGTAVTVPLYPKQITSPSEFNPIPRSSTTKPSSKEYTFRVVELIPKKGQGGRPTLAPEFKPFPSPSAEVPPTTTEAMTVDLPEPPAPINHIHINIDSSAEGSDHFLQVMVPRTTESGSSSMTITTSTTTSTIKPIFALREEPAVVEEITIQPDPASAKKPSFQHLVPTYQNSKKKPSWTQTKPKPSGSSSKEEMSSSIMITSIRSKVKEYKPHMLANYTQLIAFDKVLTDEVGIGSRNSRTAPKNSTEVISDKSLSSSSVVLSSPSNLQNTTSVSSSSSFSESTSLVDNSTNSTTESTPISPLQEFDPLKLIHAWFMKT